MLFSTTIKKISGIIKLYPGHFIALGMLLSLLGYFFEAAYNLGGWRQAFKAFGISAPELIFGDLDAITETAQCVREGLSKYGDASCIQHRTMNYPRIWLMIMNILNFSKADTFWLGITLAILFLFTTMMLFKTLSVGEGVFLGLILISPVVRLALHRENCDQIIFMLLAAACFLNGSVRRIYASTCLITIAAFLKLYPIVILLALWVENKSYKIRAALMILAFIFCLYFLYIAKDIPLMAHLTGRGIEGAFGSNIVPELLIKKLGWINLLSIDLFRKTVQLLSAGIMFSLAYGCSRYLTSLYSSGLKSAFAHSFEMRCFRMGSIVFVFMFFALGNNYDYRLIFLILCLPQALLWNKMPEPFISRCGMIICTLTILTFWLSRLSENIFYADEVFNWLLCLLLGTLLITDARKHLGNA